MLSAIEKASRSKQKPNSAQNTFIMAALISRKDKSKDHNGAAVGQALLYVGAGTDAFPLTCRELREQFSSIIYTDALPGNNYSPYFPRTEEGMLKQLCSHGGHHSGLSFTDFQLQPDGSYSAPLPNGCKFSYYFNSDIVSRVPDAVLQTVTALYIHGYCAPTDLVARLPNVKLAYSTSLCVGELYWAVYRTERSGLSIQQWNVATMMDEWECDIDESGEGGFYRQVDSYTDGPPRFASDAPVRDVFYEYEDEDEDESDDEDQDQEVET